jgi:formamidopyrimidine-DNA glycosylase
VPELPEVEVVRRGLAEHVVGRSIVDVTVRHPRAIRRHLAGPNDFRDRLIGRGVVSANRRGKFLWLGLDDDTALLGHLGMSGQMLVTKSGETPKHLGVAFDLDDATRLLFVDQRTFGGLLVTELNGGVPPEIAHIALDPLDPDFDLPGFTTRLRRRNTGIKRALLDQTLISGVGNIYADEALWRVPMHYARNTRGLRIRDVEALVGHVRDVMNEALGQGGTSFDALYVNVNGQSGYFDRSLDAYGREGKACRRCGSPMVREPFMNRSSFRCPTCQRRPRMRPLRS